MMLQLTIDAIRIFFLREVLFNPLQLSIESDLPSSTEKPDIQTPLTIETGQFNPLCGFER